MANYKVEGGFDIENKIALFEEKEIRRTWKDEKWYFSVVDVIEVLTDSLNPRDYWYKLKKRAREEEKVELSTTEITI